MKIFTLLFSFVLIWTTDVYASSNEICASLFDASSNELQIGASSDTGIRPFPFREKLLSKGVEPGNLSFHHRHVKYLFLEIAVEHSGQKIGRVKAFYNRDLQLFESHISIDNSEFRGKGLGVLMYVVLAKKIYQRYDVPLISSSAPSASAKAVWDSIVKNGWGEIFNSPEGPRYRFFQDVLANKFDDVLQLQHIEYDSQNRPLN